MMVKLKEKKIKDNRSAFIIAEISANHGQDFDRAVEIVKAAKKCGADAVKFQAYEPDTLTINVDNEYFRIKHPKWGGQTLYDLYRKTYTPWEWFKKLKKVAGDVGILFFATAFDKSSVDFLEELNVQIHKVSSFELIDLQLIEYIAKTKKPLILSTGMADVSEIEEAINTARRVGAEEITLLKCVSNYPASPEEMNLRTIPHMMERFGCAVGLSDHCLEIGVSVAAVALGARVIEKHFTLSRKHETPDSFFSIEPQEFKELVENIRVVEKALGKVYYGLAEQEKKSKIFRRSIFAVEDIEAGEVLNEKNVRSIRPGDGLKPKYINSVLGKKAKKNIKKGTPIEWGLLD